MVERAMPILATTALMRRIFTVDDGIVLIPLIWLHWMRERLSSDASRKHTAALLHFLHALGY